jgi:hypothetical protein
MKLKISGIFRFGLVTSETNLFSTKVEVGCKRVNIMSKEGRHFEFQEV